jgi:hypothetical protein
VDEVISDEEFYHFVHLLEVNFAEGHVQIKCAVLGYQCECFIIWLLDGFQFDIGLRKGRRSLDGL